MLCPINGGCHSRLQLPSLPLQYQAQCQGPGSHFQVGIRWSQTHLKKGLNTGSDFILPTPPSQQEGSKEGNKIKLEAGWNFPVLINRTNWVAKRGYHGNSHVCLPPGYSNLAGGPGHKLQASSLAATFPLATEI